MYELTEPANGRLSQWNARAIIIDKIENPTSEDEQRVTLDYSRVVKNLSRFHLKLSSKVHDNLSDFKHKVLFSADLKHAYLTISLHSKDRHYFAFTIFEIEQVQSIHVQQRFKSAEFIMTELIYRVFEVLPSLIKKLSFLHFNESNFLPTLTFYMDDFFEGFKDFDDQYEFLKYRFFFLQNRPGPPQIVLQKVEIVHEENTSP